MSEHSIKKSESLTNYTSQPQIFAEFNGIKKRKIYYNVDFTEEQQEWIRTVRRQLKQQKGVQINEDQVILRFFYSADLKIQKCLQKLDEYYKWFTSPSIQCLTSNTFQIFREGFAYSYGKARDGRPFIIMSLSILDMEKYSQDNYYQAINHSLNKAIKQFTPGYMESYYYMIDLNEQLLSLPLMQLGEVIKRIGNAYSGVLQRMYIINCTSVSKWIFNRLKGFGFISEETCSRISFATKDDLENGELRKIINQNVLEQKYGGLRPNIDHQNESVYKSDEKARIFEYAEESNETQYFSIEQNEDHPYYKEGTCCGDSDQCTIY